MGKLHQTTGFKNTVGKTKATARLLWFFAMLRKGRLIYYLII